jgi:hypothetical protein
MILLTTTVNVLLVIGVLPVLENRYLVIRDITPVPKVVHVQNVPNENFVTRELATLK